MFEIVNPSRLLWVALCAALLAGCSLPERGPRRTAYYDIEAVDTLKVPEGLSSPPAGREAIALPEAGSELAIGGEDLEMPPALRAQSQEQAR